MQRLRHILSIIDNISEWSGKICRYGVFAIVVVVTYEVGARYIFNAPTLWGHDTTQFLFGATAVLAGAYCLHHNAHVSVDIVYRHFSPRGQLILDVVASMFLFAFCGVAFWWGLQFAATSIKMLEVTQTPFRGPVYPVKAALVIGTALILLQGVAKFTRTVSSLIGKGAL